MTNSTQSRFVAILPSLRLIVAKHFRSYYNQADKDDAIAEAVAMSWKKFAALIQRGIDPEGLILSIGQRCALNVHRDAKCTVVNQQRGRSIIEPLCISHRRKHRFRTRQLFEGCIRTQQAIPDAVAFRIDFKTRRRQWSKRDLAIIDDRLAGYTCLEIARKLGVNQWNVNQRLPKYYQSWKQFALEG
jgi:DNA-directed RNA polymerase specialized sigma24 family protein